MQIRGVGIMLFNKNGMMISHGFEPWELSQGNVKKFVADRHWEVDSLVEATKGPQRISVVLKNGGSLLFYPDMLYVEESI